MAKRFTDKEKWKNPWYRKLPGKMKIAMEYLLDSCDHGGIWHVDLDLMAFQTGEEITEKEIDDHLSKHIIKHKKDKWFIVSYIDFQYGELSEESRVHQSVVKILKKERVWIAYQQSLGTLKDKDKDKDIIPESEEIEENEDCFSPQQLCDIWNDLSGILPKVQKLTKARKVAAKARISENGDRKFWVEVIQRISQSKFCQGENDRKWLANFDWLLRPETSVRVMEGQYGCSPPCAPQINEEERYGKVY